MRTSTTQAEQHSENVTLNEQGSWVASFLNYELSSVFQPIFNKDLKPIGAEALLRITTADNQSIAPNTFFSKYLKTDEDTALVENLSRYIHIRNFTLSEYAHLKLFLNVLPNMSSSVSSKELSHSDLSLAAFNNGMLTSDQVVMELVEQESSCDSCLSRTTNRLSNEGFIIAIDDYGTKASNNKRVSQINPDIIKLDRSLIEDYCAGKCSQLKAGLDAAKKVGAEIIAEGIETADQFRRMRILGIDMFQGYYLAHPHPIYPLSK